MKKSRTAVLEKKPTTGRELLAALRANGLIGLWKDRPETHSPDFAKALRAKSNTPRKRS